MVNMKKNVFALSGKQLNIMGQTAEGRGIKIV